MLTALQVKTNSVLPIDVKAAKITPKTKAIDVSWVRSPTTVVLTSRQPRHVFHQAYPG